MESATKERIGDGGPAFPPPVAEILGRATNSAEFGMPGMSLRDYFAAKAWAVLSLDVIDRIVNPNGSDPLHDEVDDQNRYVVPPLEIVNRMARASYIVADAMLKARDL